MNIIWLGHGAFRIEIAGEVLLIDPWLTANPKFPDARRAEALAGVTQILLTHGHGDHASEVEEVSKETGAPIHAIHELASWLAARGAAAKGFGCGGTVTFGEVAVTMVPASHSSSIDWLDGGPFPAGDPVGFIIKGEGHVIYASGDTGLMADMGWIGAYHKPDIGILSCGGHYTMDMAQAAWAAETWFDFRHIIPGHYATMPVFAQDAHALAAALPGVTVHEPQVMEPVTI
ncbi:metal-dependent hydrolase [Pseudoroseicyclus sp. CXY001]|uniref:metal-dependent hydrolase n=1 Tax=Pseudoroseicyclus sp. CXY001 TaxID=3242492 RepID=UPI003570CA39